MLFGLNLCLKIMFGVWGHKCRVRFHNPVPEVESDFAKGLAEIVAEEESAAADYEAQTQANEVETTSKTQDMAPLDPFTLAWV